jgi:hypothetical protein
MDALQILERLNRETGFPTDAVQAARVDKDSVIPVFVRTFEELVSSGSTKYESALFFVFHLLGEWRVKSAYRVLARFLQMPREAVESILGDAITATAHRVMAAVFDGDPVPLVEIIFDERADEFIRSRMVDAIAILTLRGDLSRTWSEQFMRECYDRLQPQVDCYVWSGWQQSIAWLGFADLKPLVQQAFARRSIIEEWLSFKDFEKDLQHTIDHPGSPPLTPDGELTLFGDTILELSTWAAFDPKSRAKKDQLLKHSIYDPKANPFHKVGRNDPCPCGSGKKFKKCCLNADLA